MLHPRFLCLCLCLALTGCTALKSSPTWSLVMNSRRSFIHEADPSEAYAQHLHRKLKARGVEHRVISYEFRYLTRLREEAIGTRTAVIYRDDSHPTHPWWLAEERLTFPRWLPNGAVERQLAFATGNHARIVTLREISSGSGGKQTIAGARRTAFRATQFSSIRPVAAGPEPTAAADWKQAFAQRHGTTFDPQSALDRRKMATLQHMH